MSDVWTVSVFLFHIILLVTFCNGESHRRLSANFIGVSLNEHKHRELRIAFKHVLVLETSAFWTTGDAITLRQVTDGRRIVQAVYQFNKMQDCEYTENSKTILYLMEQFAKGKRELLDLNNTDVFHMYSSTDFSKMSGAYKHVQHKNMLKNFRQYVNIKKQAHLCQTFYKKNYKQILQDPKSQFADSSHNISAGTNRSQIHVNNQRSKRSVPLPFLRSKRDASAASRSKRDLFSGWLIFPGTKWCGTGDIAENIHDLGYDESTDTCCRKHDHCPHLINRFSWKYNMFNYHFHTMSLCVCDNRFRRCLRRSESPTAKLVGKIYFNIISPQCFKIKRKKTCKKRNWWGTCKKYKGEQFAFPFDQKPF